MSTFLQWVTEQRWAAVVAVVIAGIDLAIGFGLDLSAHQVTLVTAFLTALGGLVIQAKVFSRQSVQNLTADVRRDAYHQGVKDEKELGGERLGAEDGGIVLDAIANLFMWVLILTFLWALFIQLARIGWGLLRAVFG